MSRNYQITRTQNKFELSCKGCNEFEWVSTFALNMICFGITEDDLFWSKLILIYFIFFFIFKNKKDVLINLRLVFQPF